MILEEIPLLAGVPDQLVDVTIVEQPYTFRILWNVRFEYWSLTIRERDGSDILTNVKMVPNYPLTARFRLLPLEGDFYFLHRAGLAYRPTFDDIGANTYGLYYYDPESEDDVILPLVPST